MSKPNVGVIVGRFQVNELHSGHHELFRQVSSLHEKIILFIGVAPTGPTRRNPLDFDTRKKMIQADYPDFTFVPLKDCQADVVWSKTLDDKIADQVVYGEVTLYGGRDSFLPHYKGIHKVHELILPVSISGTEIRANLTNRVMQSAEFRAGIIYAVNNSFPRCVTTVDIAIIHKNGLGHTSVLLGRKPGESSWRFIGGHGTPRKTFEEQAIAEVYEETGGLDVHNLVHLGSFVIDDWRWKDEVDSVTTNFYVAESMSKGGHGSDDIEEVRWFGADDVASDGFNIVSSHRVLLDRLVDYFEEIKNAAVKPKSTYAD